MNTLFYNQWLLSLIIIFVGLVFKAIVFRLMKRWSRQKKQDNRLVINTFRNLTNLLIVVAVFAVWANEIQDFALSVAAFVVAIVLATKEIIQCFIGFIYISSTTPFRVGDWVQSGNATGEVSATDWAKVTLLEVNPETYLFTGKTIFIPNSQMLVSPVKNMNFMRRYVNHTFFIVKEDEGFNPFKLKIELEELALKYCEDFKDVAERYAAVIENRLEVAIPGPEPEIKVSTTDLGKTKFSFSLFCPTNKARNIEQQLTADFYSLWFKLKQAEDKKGLTKGSA